VPGVRVGDESRSAGDAVAVASSLLRSGRTREALLRFEEALAQEPSHLEARRGVARSLLRLGEVERARELYGEMLARVPDDVEALTGLGTCSVKAGEPEAAIDLLRMAQRLRPGHVSSAIKLADALSSADRSDEALVVLDTACHLHPEASRLRVALARLHVERGEAGLAEQELMALQGLPRGDRSETYASARAWMRLGRHERAIPLLEGLLAVGGTSRDDAAATALLEAMLALEQWERALEFAERIAPGGMRTVLPNPREPTAEPVPALIHQYWEPGELPADYRVRSEEWGRRNPDCEHRLWGAAEAEGLLADFSDDARRAFRSLRHPAMRADLFRYAVLLRQGGVYLDANLTAAVPLRLSVLTMPGFHATAGRNSVGRPIEEMSIRNDFIAAPAGHPIILTALSTSVRNVLDRSAPNLIALAGPPVLSQAFREVIHDGARGAGNLHVWETLHAQCLRGSLPRPAEQERSHWSHMSFDAGFR
jgi:tetratricopeptide (TPR) repeat protein